MLEIAIREGRMMRRMMMLASLAGMVISSSAHARELLFTYTETMTPGGLPVIDASWKQSSSPVPISYVTDFNTQVAVSDWSGTVGPESSIFWDAAANDGGFITPDFQLNTEEFQVYGGTEAAPTFAPGTFSLFDLGNGNFGTLVISAVPEPSTWAFVLIGVMALGAAVRVRSRARAEI